MTSLFLTITPSLNGFLIGLLAGAAVLGGIAAGLLFLSQADQIR
jgi:photosystem II PsbX protein